MGGGYRKILKSKFTLKSKQTSKSIKKQEQLGVGCRLPTWGEGGYVFTPLGGCNQIADLSTASHYIASCQSIEFLKKTVLFENIGLCVFDHFHGVFLYLKLLPSLCCRLYSAW